MRDQRFVPGSPHYLGMSEEEYSALREGKRWSPWEQAKAGILTVGLVLIVFLWAGMHWPQALIYTLAVFGVLSGYLAYVAKN